jgi:hypothetical protein
MYADGAGSTPFFHSIALTRKKTMTLTRHPKTTGIRYLVIATPLVERICQKMKPTVPQMMEMRPEFFVALGMTSPRP